MVGVVAVVVTCSHSAVTTGSPGDYRGLMSTGLGSETAMALSQSMDSVNTTPEEEVRVSSLSLLLPSSLVVPVVVMMGTV